MYIGIDVGGTNIAAALVTPQWHIVKKTSRPTLPGRGAGAVIDDLRDIIREMSAGLADGVQAIGIGVPGVVDNKAGYVFRTPNMPLDGTPLVRMLGQDVPVYLGNDANVAALGEYRMGAARGVNSMVMVTLGTGVGGGFIMDGRIVEGVGGAAAEIGHIVVCRNGLPCTCGRRGCWEKYASASALIRMTEEAMQAHPESLLKQAMTGDPPHVSGRTAFDAARQGDGVAQSVLDEYIDWLAEGALNVIIMLQPEVLCVGGGVSGEGDALLVPLKQRIEARQYCPGIRQTEVKKAILGNDAGLIGAALLADHAV
ncbi:MAG: ROK family protein [Oscillospiraceae bacterium]|nr:ROK family protein [Oscillospiraceae bacterium]